jgi:O-antigen/teichoic acid export membrane protein
MGATPNNAMARASPLMVARILVAACGFFVPLAFARWLLPAAYGTFKQAWLLSSTLYIVLSFGITQSLLFFLPRERGNSTAYVSHVLAANWLAALVGGAALLFFGEPIALLFHNPELSRVMPLVAAICAFRLAGQSWDFVYLGSGRVKTAAAIRAVYETFQTASLLIAVALTRSLFGVLLALAFATFIRAILCAGDLIRHFGLRFDRSRLAQQLRYALPFGGAFALLIPQQQFHLYAVSAFVPASLFAIYSVGCMQLPVVDMLYTPISDVLQLGIAEQEAKGRPEQAVHLFREAVSRLSLVFIPAVVVLMVVAPDLIRLLFTDRYAAAVPLFRVSLLFVPMSALPLDAVMRAKAQSRFMLLVASVKLLLTVILVEVGLRSVGTPGALLGWMLAEEIGRAMMLWRAARVLRTSIVQLLPGRRMALCAFAAVAGAVVSLPLLQLAVSTATRLAVTGTLFLPAYVAALWVMGVLPPLRSRLPLLSRSPRVATSE